MDINTLSINDLNVMLKFISKIPDNKVLDITNKRYQDPNAWLTSISRWYYGESRYKTIIYLNSLIEQSIKLLGSIKEPESTTLLNNLNSCINGINNLSKHYRDETIASCEFDALIDRIKEVYAKFNKSKRQDTVNSNNNNYNNNNTEFTHNIGYKP